MLMLMLVMILHTLFHFCGKYNNGLCGGVLQIEEDCMLGSANDIAEAVHHILSIINGS